MIGFSCVNMKAVCGYTTNNAYKRLQALFFLGFTAGAEAGAVALETV
jgi:hypothetical protein